MTASDTKIFPTGVPFTQIPNALILDARITSVQRLVYVYLMYRANSTGQCFPAMRTIAHELVMSKTTVSASITALEKHGWLEVSRDGKQTEGNRRPVNQYLVHGTLPDSYTKSYDEMVARREKSLYQEVVRAVPGGGTGLVPGGGTKQQSTSNNNQEQQGVAALATLAYTKITTGKRNELWDVLTVTHGEPVTKSERSHRGKIVNDLFLAGVTVDEYPILIRAFVSKWDGKQPGPASIANRIGEYRDFVENGPITAPDIDEIVQQRIMAQHIKETK